MDTTSATLDKEPWILKHDAHKIQFKDYDNEEMDIYENEGDFKPYNMYIHNLIEVREDNV